MTEDFTRTSDGKIALTLPNIVLALKMLGVEPFYDIENFGLEGSERHPPGEGPVDYFRIRPSRDVYVKWALAQLPKQYHYILEFLDKLPHSMMTAEYLLNEGSPDNEEPAEDDEPYDPDATALDWVAGLAVKAFDFPDKDKAIPCFRQVIRELAKENHSSFEEDIDEDEDQPELPEAVKRRPR